MSPTAMTHLGDDINDYIAKSGGLTDVADINHIYVIHANGEAEKASIGSYLFASNHVDVKKGDVIVVPKKLVFDTNMDIAGSIADIFYKLTLTVASLHTVGAL
jgi:protein involved in polysaccharide export with SLBB domain